MNGNLSAEESEGRKVQDSRGLQNLGKYELMGELLYKTLPFF